MLNESAIDLIDDTDSRTLQLFHYRAGYLWLPSNPSKHSNKQQEGAFTGSVDAVTLDRSNILNPSEVMLLVLLRSS